MFRARFILALLALVAVIGVRAESAYLQGVRMSTDGERTRVVLDLSQPIVHRLFTLSEPARVVLDLEQTQLASTADVKNIRLGSVEGIRTGQQAPDVLRVVLDLTGSAQPSSFMLTPGAGHGHRLVVDLIGSSVSQAKPVKTVSSLVESPRDVMIAIDAGHGGKDPGASGRKGTKEKHVALQIAKRFAAQIESEPGMRPVLIRDRDEFLGHRERIQIARAQNADLFVSIHADAFHDRRARGSSVYVLSRRGASSEAARWLAERENAALLGGVSLDDKDEELAYVLLDLSQTATISASLDAADAVLKELGKINRLHSKKVNQAGFLVLKSPDIPSILIETAFISNPSEEQKLRDAKHQEKLARALMDGVRRYFSEYAPPGTLLAELNRARAQNMLVEHVITRGDTLSEIAARYRVTVSSLRRVNGLRGDRIRIGQVLRIPLAAGS